MSLMDHAQLVMSGSSLLVTGYFWLVKARREQPCLEFHQLSDFRAMVRSHPDRKDVKRLCLQQLDSGGVLAVNHSTRQNSVVLFDCYLQTDVGEIRGDWGYVGEDKPPWNIGPESTIAMSPACFFDVPLTYELPDNPQFAIHFITASGKVSRQQFAKLAPRWLSQPAEQRRAA